MSVLGRIDRIRRLWSILVPQFACPDDAQVYRWAGRFDDAIIEHGLQRVRAKIAKGGLFAVDIVAKSKDVQISVAASVGA